MLGWTGDQRRWGVSRRGSLSTHAAIPETVQQTYTWSAHPDIQQSFTGHDRSLPPCTRRKKKVNPNTENSWNSQQRKHCGRFMWDREQGVNIHYSETTWVSVSAFVIVSHLGHILALFFFSPTTGVRHVYRTVRLCRSYPQLTQTGVRVVDAPRVCAAPSWWGASQWSQCGCREAWCGTSGRWLRTHMSHVPNQKNDKNTSPSCYS